jgi:hypothetical protein
MAVVHRRAHDDVRSVWLTDRTRPFVIVLVEGAASRTRRLGHSAISASPAKAARKIDRLCAESRFQPSSIACSGCRQRRGQDARMSGRVMALYGMIFRAGPAVGAVASETLPEWANPFKIGRDGTRTEVITKYRDHLWSRPELIALRSKKHAPPTRYQR